MLHRRRGVRKHTGIKGLVPVRRVGGVRGDGLHQLDLGLLRLHVQERAGLDLDRVYVGGRRDDDAVLGEVRLDLAGVEPRALPAAHVDVLGHAQESVAHPRRPLVEGAHAEPSALVGRRAREAGRARAATAAAAGPVGGGGRGEVGTGAAELVERVLPVVQGLAPDPVQGGPGPRLDLVEGLEQHDEAEDARHARRRRVRHVHERVRPLDGLPVQAPGEGPLARGHRPRAREPVPRVLRPVRLRRAPGVLVQRQARPEAGVLRRRRRDDLVLVRRRVG